MKTGTANRFSRLVCMVLAVLTVVTAIPMLATDVEAKNPTTGDPVSVAFDFESGTVDSKFTSVSNGGFVAEENVNLTYYNDPITGASNKVIGPTSGKNNSQLVIKDSNNALLNSAFSIEGRFYIDSMSTQSGNSGNPLSLIAINGKSSSTASDENIPLVRVKLEDLSSTTAVLQGKTTDSYYDTPATIELDKWYTIRVDVIDTLGYSYAAIYLGGEFVSSKSFKDRVSINHIRILQPNGIWNAYVDDIKITKTVADKINAYESFESGTLNKQVWGYNFISQYPTSPLGSGGAIYIRTDPDNSQNKVVKGSESSFNMYFIDPGVRLVNTSFVASADIRFDSFPTVKTTGESQPTSIICWVCGDSYYTLCRVDGEGNLLDKDNNKSGVKLKLNTWHNIAVVANGKTGEYEAYLDGRLAFSFDMGNPSSAVKTSYVRFMYSDSSYSYVVMLDNLRLYEIDTPAEPDEEEKVIWDVNLDDLAEGTQITQSVWNSVGYKSECIQETGKEHLVVAKYNGSNAIKIKNGTDGQHTTLAVGHGTYDPLKNSTVSVKLDFTLDDKGTTPKRIGIIRWRNFDESKNPKAMSILEIEPNLNILFCGNETDITIAEKETYRFEVVLNGIAQTASLYINETLVVDSFPVCNSSSGFDVEGRTYFLDDAGIKRFVPYTGFIKSYFVDANGEKIEDANGNDILVDEFVFNRNIHHDMIRLFQGSTDATSTYYVDNLKVERIETERYFGSTFTGWEQIKEAKAIGGDSNNDRRYKLTDVSIADNGINEYLVAENYKQYNESGSLIQKHALIYDKHNVLVGKDVTVNADVYLTAVSSVGASSFMSVCTYIGNTADKYPVFLRADGEGNLYRDGDSVNPIAKLKVGTWNNIKINLLGDGNTWTDYQIIVNDVLAYENATTNSTQNLNKKQNTRLMFRFTNIAETVVYFDNLTISPYVPKTDDLVLDFENDEETEATLNKFAFGWNFADFGQTRTDRAGQTVVSAQILGDEDAKYLKINHEKVSADSLKAYFDVNKSAVIDEQSYVIKTAVRYSANSGYSLNVAEIYDDETDSSAQLVAVRGDTNALFSRIRGVQYDLLTSYGRKMVAKKLGENDFTEISVLVDDANKTFTLYVDGRLAYYDYDGELLPFANVPMHFIAAPNAVDSDYIRLLEIPETKFCDASMEVDFISVASLENGLGAKVKGGQTKKIDDDNYAVRFVSGIDELYGTSIGFEITAQYEDESGKIEKTYELSTATVFGNITADNEVITAEQLGCGYISVSEITDVPTDISAIFYVTPFVEHNGEKFYGERNSFTYKNGQLN